ncbi:MAG: FoF1 ATP synthase subunit a [Chloroflexota bacterium]|nr:FoF1 ATP synthase subunit a [Chloroflexota bacterium]
MQKILTPRNILIIVGILAVMIASAVLIKIPLPTIVLSPEIVFHIGNFPVTNTLIATFLADIVILVLAFFATRNMKDVPSGLQNLVEWFVETFFDMAEDVAGKSNAKKFFGIFMTLLIFLLVANWMELLPGVDTIGKIEPLEVAYAEAGVTSGFELRKGIFGIPSLDGAKPIDLTDEQIHEIEEAMAHGDESHGDGAHHESAYGGYVLLPYMRGAATDLNVPLALALISVFWTQVIGVQALGLSYFRKFIMPPVTGSNSIGMKLIEVFVGILEIISEFAKIISFTFRLFGNIFAGAILLFVMTFLVPFITPVPFYGLEVFVGFMQAFVFAFLTLIFMAMAVISHDHDSEHQ